jgi:hypothetical protein
VSENVTRYPLQGMTLGPQPGFEADVSFRGDLWPSAFAQVKREAPQTAQFLEELFDVHSQLWPNVEAQIDSTPWKYDRLADLLIYIRPKPDDWGKKSEWDIYTEIHVHGWDDPDDLAKTWGLDDDLTGEFIDWYDDEGPVTTNLDPGVTCTTNDTVGSLGDFHAAVLKAIPVCEVAADVAWSRVQDKLDEFAKGGGKGALPRKLKSALSSSHTEDGEPDRGPGRRRRRGEVL